MKFRKNIIPILTVLLLSINTTYLKAAPGEVREQVKITEGRAGFVANLDAGDNFGYSVSRVGDLDNDGVMDIVVGSPGDDDGSGTDKGAIRILFMNTDGTVKSSQKLSATNGGFSGALDSFDYFGSSVTYLNDLDGDSVEDIAVGAYGDDDGGNGRGAIWILFLNTDGTVKSHQKISDTSGSFSGTLTDGAEFGRSLGSVLINAGSRRELLVGAPDDNTIFVLFLNSNGTVSSFTSEIFNSGISYSNGYSIASTTPKDDDGNRIIAFTNFDNFSAGNFDSNYRLRIIESNGNIPGDSPNGYGGGSGVTDEGISSCAWLNVPAPSGNADAIVYGSNWSTNQNKGQLSIVGLRNDSGFFNTIIIREGDGGFDRLGLSQDADDLFGYSVAAIGDLNNDGIDDLVAGVIGDDDGGNDAGAIRILFMDGGQELDVSPTSNNFGTRYVNGGPPSPHLFTIQNTGFSDLAFDSISITGTDASEFSFSSTPNTSNLTGGGSRSVSIVFIPTSGGSKSATLEIISNDDDESTIQIPLTGTGINPDIASPSSRSFGIQDVNGGATSTMPVTIQNLGDTTLEFSSISIIGSHPGDFSSTNGLSTADIAPSGSRTYNIQFDPTAIGSRSATLRIESNDIDELITDVSLTGTGINPEIRGYPGSIDLGSQYISQGNSPSQTITIENDGTTNLELSSVSIIGAHASDFTFVSGPDTSDLTPSATRDFEIQFDPSAIGSRTAILRLETNDFSESVVNVTLNGTGIDPEIRGYPASIDLGSHNIDQGNSTSQTLTIENDGTTNLELSNVSIIGTHASEFSFVSGPDTSDVLPSSTRDFEIQFDPSALGARTATLRLETNDFSESVVDVNLICIGILQQIGLSTSSIDFGDDEIGDGPAPSNFLIISNTGTDDLEINDLNLSGAAAFNYFGYSNPTTLATSETLTLEITFDPWPIGEYNATLEIFSNDVDHPTTSVLFSGTGVDTQLPTSSITSPNGSLTQQDPIILIEYDASDNIGGSRIQDVELFYNFTSTKGTAFTSAGTFTSSPIGFDTTAIGGQGTYEFYTLATDQAGNTETDKATADVTVIFNNNSNVDDWMILNE